MARQHAHVAAASSVASAATPPPPATQRRASPRTRASESSAASVLSGSFVSRARNASELASKLQRTWLALQQQRCRTEDHTDDVHASTHELNGALSMETLRLVVADVCAASVVNHRDAHIRSLGACCVAELLRVAAPHSPFASGTTVRLAFRVMLEQVRQLATTSSSDDKKKTIAKRTGAGTGAGAVTTAQEVHGLHVLESLARVPTFRNIWLEVSDDTDVLGSSRLPEQEQEDNEDDQAEEHEKQDKEDAPLLVQVFRTFFETLHSDHAPKIEALMRSIMATCLDESDAIDAALLDVLLAPLVNVQEAQEADGEVRVGPYHMAQTLIRQCSERLQPVLLQFFNGILVNAPGAAEQTAKSDLKEHVYTLIYEVHKILPSCLLYVLPNVCLQLQVDEAATRSDAIALLGRLFASGHADYGEEYSKLFREFLGRFRDVDKEIRRQMVQIAVLLWQRKPALGEQLEPELIQRLQDPEWEVRRLVVNEVCDLAANHLELVSDACLRAVGERMKDKKVVVRKETMTGLGQVYAMHISKCWLKTEDDDASDISLSSIVPNEAGKKLAWIPDYVLKCFAYPQAELKLRVIQLIDDILLPKDAAETVRAKGLVWMMHAMDATAKEALRRILVEKSQCRLIVAAYLRARAATRGQKGDDGALDKAQQELVRGLAPFSIEGDKLSKLVAQLTNLKDQSVFKQLTILCDVKTRQEASRAARDRLVRSVGTKTPLGGFLRSLCRRLNMSTISEATVETYLSFLESNGRLPDRENRYVIDILQLASQVLPQLFAPFVKKQLESVLVQDTTDREKADKDEDDEEEDDDDDELDSRVLTGLLEVVANLSVFWKAHDKVDDPEQLKDDSMPSDKLRDFLQKCCLAQVSVSREGDASRITEYAARAFANFFGSSKHCEAIMTKLVSKKALIMPPTLSVLPKLTSLHVLCKSYPEQIASGKAVVDTLWETLLHQYIQVQSSASSVKKSKTSLTATKAADVRCLAIKVAADLVINCYTREDDSTQRERAEELIHVLLDVLRSDGRSWTSTQFLQARYRVAAATTLLRMMRNRHVESLFSVSEWHLLGFVLQDTNEQVRQGFLKKLTAHLMKKTVPHPHKYMSFLALAATEVNPALKKNARMLLEAAVERMRHMFEASLLRGDSSNIDNGEDKSQRQNLNALMVPEYALPYVIHLLSHHPDFPQDAIAEGQRIVLDDPIWSEQNAYLTFFLEGLVSSTASSSTDNIAFLLQLLSKLSDCQDVTDSSSRAMYPLIKCAVALLQRRIRNQSDLKAYPGKIFLPKQLFAARRVTASAGSINPRNSAQGDIVLAGNADERSLPQIGVALSPIKASNGSARSFLALPSPPLSARKRRKSSVSATSTKRSRKSDDATSDDNTTADSARRDSVTPSRRQSLMRKVRAQAKTFVDESSESGDDSDDYVVGASVASRMSRSESKDSHVSNAISDATKKRPFSTQDHETSEAAEDADDDNEKQANTRRPRRRRKL